jgi:hypothetical protein
VLRGYYRVKNTPTALLEEHGRPAEEAAVYDILGLSAVLFRHVASGADSQGTQIVEQSKEWFDSLWDTIATDSSEI